MMDKLLTVKELAEILGISPGTVYHWVAANRLPPVRFSKRCLRFRESEIAKLMETLSHFPETNRNSCK